MTTTMSAAPRPIAKGDIVLVMYPFTDLSGVKRRPAVVIWADPAQVDFTLAFITSQNVGRLQLGESAILPGHTEFAMTGLRTASRIRATKLVTLSHSLITRRLGYLGPVLLSELDNALVAALSIDIRRYTQQGRQEERTRLIAIGTTQGSDAVLMDLGLPARLP